MIRRQAIFASLFPHLQPSPLATPPTDVNVGDPNVTLSDLEYQDISIGEESPTPRTGQTFGDYQEQQSFQPTDILTGTVSPQGATWEQRNPEFQYPHTVEEGGKLTGQQSAENSLAQARYRRANPQNEDRGVKGVLKEILGNFFEGLRHAKPGMGLKESLLLGGVGAGAGAINRTWNERRELDQLIPTLEKDVAMESQNSLRNEQISTIRRDDKRQQDDLSRKLAKDERDYEIKALTLNFKKEDRERYYELEDVKVKAKEKGDQRLYDLAVEKQKEIARHNGVTEKQAATNEEGRNKRASMTQQGQDRRTQIAIEAKRTLEEFKQAQTNGRTDKANELKLKLQSLKKEKDELDVGASATAEQ